MDHFNDLYDRAVGRHGEEAIAARMPECLPPSDLRVIPDDRYLSAMSKMVFAAGFRWKVVRAKWPTTEDAFDGFVPAVVAAYDDQRIAELKEDTRIIRNGPKILTTVENARWVAEMAHEHGSLGQWIADWPADDIIALWAALKKGGSRLGGATGPRFLRHIGKDTFILTEHVAGALAEMGVMTGKPTSKGAQRQAQHAFNTWKDQSGLPLCQISTLLAMSWGPVYGA